ncbi:MAG: glycosyltransferase family 9 protein [bacterium]|nr:glycosyltransferase family 9 protein [bacterium]
MYHFDCRYFVGEKPCKFKVVCQGCSHYAPVSERILIIKLAAIGDVLRTTPLLTGLKKKYPRSFITWLTDPGAAELLNNIPELDRLLRYNGAETLTRLLVERFDILICLDKEVRATGLAMLVNAQDKIGFGLNQFGTIFPFDTRSEYAFELGVNDELKFRLNRKTYPEILYEMVGLPYHKEEYVFQLAESSWQKAKEKAKQWKFAPTDLIVGLNTGAGSVFATKKWTISGFIKLAELIYKKYQPKVKLLLLGGPEEIGRNQEILKNSRVPLIDTGTDNSLTDFSGLINLCDIVITADSLAMHLAIALKKHVVALFGPTVAQEIEFYGRGEPVIARADCAPCYRQKCNQLISCMDRLEAKTVFRAVEKVVDKLNRKKTRKTKMRLSSSRL